MSLNPKVSPSEIEALLRTDPYQDGVPDGTNFALRAIHSRCTEDALSSIGDTTFSMTMRDYLANLVAYGFAVVLHEPISSFHCGNGPHVADLYVLWKPGFLVVTDTFGKNRNGATIYATRVLYPDGKLYYWNGVHVPDEARNYSKDAREALRHSIEEAEFASTPGTAPEPYYMPLLSWADYHAEGPSADSMKLYETALKQLTPKRWARLPENVRVQFPNTFAPRG